MSSWLLASGILRGPRYYPGPPIWGNGALPHDWLNVLLLKRLKGLPEISGGALLHQSPTRITAYIRPYIGNVLTWTPRVAKQICRGGNSHRQFLCYYLLTPTSYMHHPINQTAELMGMLRVTSELIRNQHLPAGAYMRCSIELGPIIALDSGDWK